MEKIIVFLGSKNRSELMLRVLFMLVILLSSLALSASHIIIDTLNSYQWDSKKHTWTAFERKIVVYNDKDKLSEITQILCKKSWLNYSMRSYSYDKANLLQEMTEKFWSDNLKTWSDNYKEVFLYNLNNQVDSIIHYNIFENVLFEDAIELITYTAYGKPANRIYKQFADEWTNQIIYEYNYYGDKITTESISYWDENKWEKPLYKTSYQYDADGNLVKLIKRQRRSMEDYQSIACETYQYDRNGVILSQATQIWDNVDGMWEETSKTEYSRDFKGHIQSSETLLSDDGNWFNYQKDELISDNNSVPSTINSGDLSFWVVPSKFKNSMTIEFNNPENLRFKVRILNSKGNVITQSDMPDNRITLDTKNISKGEYFLEVTGNGHFAGKFIID